MKWKIIYVEIIQSRVQYHPYEQRYNVNEREKKKEKFQRKEVNAKRSRSRPKWQTKQIKKRVKKVLGSNRNNNLKKKATNRKVEKVKR